MDYNQALARTTQMHIQIDNKGFRITIIYDFAKVIKVDTCIWYMWYYLCIGIKALFSSQKNLQNFSDSPSHRIFRFMHGVLNIDENKN